MNQKTRAVYLDALRIAATIAVIILHTSAQNWSSTEIMGLSWSMFTVYDSCVRWAVPAFLMISGALFLRREISLEMIYKKYILRMMTAFGAWSALYALVEWGGGKELYPHYSGWALSHVVHSDDCGNVYVLSDSAKNC